MVELDDQVGVAVEGQVVGDVFRVDFGVLVGLEVIVWVRVVLIKLSYLLATTRGGRGRGSAYTKWWR
jgi:hypothetical protein